MAKSNKFKVQSYTNSNTKMHVLTVLLNSQVMDEVCGVFITFEHQRSCERCLEDYRWSSYSFMRFFQPPELQFLHSETVSAHHGCFVTYGWANAEIK